MKPRPLKVYRILLANYRAKMPPNRDPQRPHVVAATSQRAAATAFGCTIHELRNYGGETGNADPARPKETSRNVAEFIRDGLKVERVPLSFVRDPANRIGCECGRQGVLFGGAA